jgi:MFS family permease
MASATEIGWLTGVALVGAAVVSPFIGFIARFFDRRLLLALSLVLQGPSSLAVVFVHEVDLLAFVLRIMQGVGFVLVFNCTTTMAADILDEKDLARGVGYLGVAMMLTNALAPLVVEPLVEQFNWDAAFVGSGIIALVALLIVPRMVDPKAPALATTPELPKSRAVLRVHYGSFMMGAGLGAMFTFVQPFALAQGATQVGQFFLGYVATAVGVRILFGHLPDRVGPRRVSAYSLALYSLVLFSTAWLTEGLLILAGAGLGVAHGFCYPALSAAGLFMTKATQRPVFMGWFACAFNGGFAVTVLLLGPVADHFGYPTLFSTVGLLIATAVPPLLEPKVRRNVAPAILHP